MKSFSVDDRNQLVTITTDEHFAQQDFTDKQVGQIYRKVKKALPKPYSKYRIQIVSNGMLVEDYVPSHKSKRDGSQALWGKINYNGRPWVDNASRPIDITHGLYDRHISLWASHGRYYDNKKAFGNGKGPIFLAPQKTCSLKPSWCHSSFPCSRTQELWCSLHVNATGKPMSISSTTMVASTPLTANTRNMRKAEVG